MLHVETRCPLDPDAIDAWYPGDLNIMFERIVYSDDYKQYQPVVLSKPPEGPWVIMFDNAISESKTPGGKRFGIDGSNLPAGVYFLKVNVGNEVLTEKIIRM